VSENVEPVREKNSDFCHQVRLEFSSTAFLELEKELYKIIKRTIRLLSVRFMPSHSIFPPTVSIILHYPKGKIEAKNHNWFIINIGNFSSGK